MINAPLSECERGVQEGRHKATLPPRADGGAAVAFDKRPRFSSSSLEPFLQFRSDNRIPLLQSLVCQISKIIRLRLHAHDIAQLSGI